MPRSSRSTDTAPDTREVAGGGKRKRRKQRRSPSDERRELRRLGERIQRLERDADLYSRGEYVGEFTLDELYQQIRLARAILAAKTGDEGEAFERPAGKLESGEIIVARGRAREMGERLPVRMEAPRGA